MREPPTQGKHRDDNANEGDAKNRLNSLPLLGAGVDVVASGHAPSNVISLARRRSLDSMTVQQHERRMRNAPGHARPKNLESTPLKEATIRTIADSAYTPKLARRHSCTRCVRQPNEGQRQRLGSRNTEFPDTETNQATLSIFTTDGTTPGPSYEVHSMRYGSLCGDETTNEEGETSCAGHIQSL